MSAAHEKNRLIGLQVLRAVAALMVVFHHARLSIPGSDIVTSAGETGVDIFFVISGFVMAYTTARLAGSAPMAERVGAAREFFTNRLLRVVPLYWLAMAWTAHRGYGSRFTAGDIVQDLFFLPHLSTEFPRSIFPVVVQGWTLDYEMFFYALFAFSLVCGARARQVLVGCIVLLVGAGLWLALQDGIPLLDDTQRMFGSRRETPFVWAVFYTNNIMLEFCLGIVLEGWTRRFGFPAWPRWRFVALLISGLAVLAAMHLQWPRGLMQGLPAVLVVWSSIPAFKGLRMRVLELLGNASYAIYLFHWAAFAALKPLLSAIGTGPNGVGKVCCLLAAHVAVAAAVGVGVHLVIEKPLTRELKRRFGRRASREPLAAASP